MKTDDSIPTPERDHGGEGGEGTGVALPAADLTGEVEQLRAENRELRLADAVRNVLAAKLTDPTDLLRFVKETDRFLDDDGRPDHDAILVAGDELLEARPYLARRDPTKAAGPGSGRFDGGARTPERLVLTMDEVARMSPQEVANAIGRGQVPGVGSRRR